MSEQKTSKQWILPLVIIPFIIILLTAYFVLNYANGRPLLSLPFDTEKTAKSTDTSNDQELVKRLKVANNEIKKLRNEKEEQKQTLQVKEQEITKLISERDQLKKASTPAASTTSTNEKKTKKTPVSDVYAEMSPKEAALIFNELSPTEVVSIIENIDAEQQAAIIAKMDAKKAAALTQLLASE